MKFEYFFTSFMLNIKSKSVKYMYKKQFQKK